MAFELFVKVIWRVELTVIKKYSFCNGCGEGVEAGVGSSAGVGVSTGAGTCDGMGAGMGAGSELEEVVTSCLPQHISEVFFISPSHS